MKRQSIYGLVFLVVTACGGSETAPSEAKAEAAAPLRVTNTRAVATIGDSTPPQSVVFIEQEPDANGEYHHDVSVLITATDDAAGVDTIFWSLSGAQTGSGQRSGDEAYVPVINEDGITTLTYYARDNGGNYEPPHTLQIHINSSTATCGEVHLADFNLYVNGDYSGGHDVRGKVAAGGTLSMQYFSVGAGLDAADTGNTLVSGGALNILNGGLFGDAHYGSTTTANGTVTFERGALSSGSDVDFNGRADELASLSGGINTAIVNGTTDFQSWGGLFMHGSDPKVNVFQIQASTLASTRYFSLSVPSGSVAVVNVWGATATISGFANDYSGVDATGVLFNFPDATSIDIHGYGVFGTVLAPFAHIDFNNGSFDGGIYADSMTGNAEGHLAPLRTFVICGDGVGT
jgi:choice-of-anchor A domain-containing protein